MLTGVALVVIGVVILLTAPAFFDVASSADRQRLAAWRDKNMPGVIEWVMEQNARWGARSTVWFGRAVGLFAVIGGIVVLARS